MLNPQPLSTMLPSLGNNFSSGRRYDSCLSWHRSFALVARPHLVGTAPLAMRRDTVTDSDGDSKIEMIMLHKKGTGDRLEQVFSDDPPADATSDEGRA